MNGFKSCQSLVEGFEIAGRPPSSRIDENVEKVREIHEDWRLTINNVCNILRQEYGTCARDLIENLNMRLIPTKIYAALAE